MATTTHTIVLKVEVEKPGEFPPSFSEAEQAVILAVGQAIALKTFDDVKITNVRPA